MESKEYKQKRCPHGWVDAAQCEPCRTADERDKLREALQRIVSYYDLAKTGSSLPSMTTQAKADHENTMFGAARNALQQGNQYSLPDDVPECGLGY